MSDPHNEEYVHRWAMVGRAGNMKNLYRTPNLLDRIHAWWWKGRWVKCELTRKP